MNLVQKKYLMNRIETLSREKKVDIEKKEVNERDIIKSIGIVSDNLKNVVLGIIESGKGWQYGNSISIDVEQFVANHKEVEKVIKQNQAFNTKIYKKELLRNQQIDKDVASLNDKIMFGTDEECYKLLDEFANKEYKV